MIFVVGSVDRHLIEFVECNPEGSGILCQLTIDVGEDFLNLQWVRAEMSGKLPP